VNQPELLKTKGPLLIASNHPNSFLDAILYDILFDTPIWSLARGDVFKRFPRFVPLLKSLKIFPIYRTREGTENLADNYKTFEACMYVFEKNEIVTIFSEALSVNEWHLRPLKKGTARIAFKAWEQNIPLKVLPVGINYSSFRRYGKKVDVNLGEIFTSEKFNLNESDGNLHVAFNKELEEQFSKLVYEIPFGDNKIFDQKFIIPKNKFKKILLLIPSALAIICHAPIYIAAKYFVKKLVNNSDHYDSVLFAFLLFAYPVYLILVSMILWFITKSAWSFLALIILPLLVFCFVKSEVRKDKSFLM
jgi:1-acyl-sn-glycerol-3-phosphate acyltransferase